VPQFFSNKRLIFLLVCIILLVALIGFSLRDRGNISWPERFGKDIVGLGQSIVSTPSQNVADFFTNLADLKNTYTENEKLKTHLEELAKIESEVKDLKKENIELKGSLGVKDDIRSYDPIQATVIARNPDQWEELVVINKGKVNGIKPNMAVVNAKGLIGKVKSTSQFTSTIELLTANDPNNRISAAVQGEKDAYGLIEGYDEEKGQLLLKRLPFDSNIKKGDKVISSGLGGIFPRGLVIGTVEQLKTDQYGLTQIGYIKPSAQMYDLEHIMVIKRGITGVNLPKGTAEEAS
jgi:rod shape-determining protein MreC